ncbi:efflux RND transporter periplasmic adaptor subunit [Micavibrio aeruginosavorus]|uniref:Macrolide-specific efflux protein MacA n=1 Tax=Micavibrio aeruginosavorus EPB TaxID=349215 RepID=M4VGP9_9BACT|nr:efflux RND transporter periplasmic adaptor subunit [Micavibrio aeruginosavorus]AGH97231.1 Macrolide-specific efflux protein MacA [Micavibrio aeruginosavorus EPB]
MSVNGPKRRRFKFVLITLLVLVAVGAGAWFAWKAPASKNPAATMMTVKVQTTTVDDVVTAQGKLEPRDYVDVGAQVSGQLEKIHFELGDVVKAGDLLAEIDPEVYETRVEADQARLKTLAAQRLEQEASVLQAQQKFDRNKKLVKAKAVSQENFQDAETALTIAQAQLAALDAQIAEAQSTLEGDQANLGYTKIYAPMDGTVVVQSVQEGQTLNASQQAPTLVQLANLDTMTVRAQVAEADIMRLKADMPVSFTTLGSQGRTWTGTVRQILPSPETINDVVLYNVLVDVDNKDRQLMTGMSTQMFFEINKAENVLALPVSALGKRVQDQDGDGTLAYSVRVVQGRKIEDRVVQIGLMNRTMAEVKSGLSAGDEVALPLAVTSSSSGGFRGGPRL